MKRGRLLSVPSNGNAKLVPLMRKFSGPAISILISLALGCSGANPEKVEVQIAAASSTVPALERLEAAIEEEFPEVNFVIIPGASSALANQIEQGLSADLFLCAGLPWATYLKERDFVHEETVLLSNVLVVAGPFSSEPFKDIQELLDVKRISMPDPESVPAGIFGKQALTRAGIWEEIQPKLVFTSDVREAAANLETGSVEAAILYQSDLVANDKLTELFKFPAEWTEPILYPLQLFSAGEEAVLVYRFLQQKSAIRIFEESGFQRPNR